jgi:hypothetical protein
MFGKSFLVGGKSFKNLEKCLPLRSWKVGTGSPNHLFIQLWAGTGGCKNPIWGFLL